MEFARYTNRSVRHFFVAPLLYLQFIPLVFLDIFVEIYHRIAFPLLGIPLVSRSRYIRADRHKLPYLSVVNKINCVYCGYANGLLPYAAEIAARTEHYWCGIKNQEGGDYVPPAHHGDFLPYGDEKAFREYVSKKKRP